MKKEVLRFNEEKFKELQNFVRIGSEENINNWFDTNIGKNKKKQKALVFSMLNSHYFFSLPYYPQNMSIKEVERETLRRELAVLSNFSIEFQLRLFSPTVIDKVSSEHFSVIKNTKNNREVLAKSDHINSVVTKWFHEGKYSDIDKIEKKYKLNFMEQKTKGITFAYEEHSSSGFFFVTLKEDFFCPKYDIAFSFTESKKDYLEKRGIELPSIEEVNELQKLLLTALNENSWIDRKTFRDLIEDFGDKYRINKSKLDLFKSLPENNSSKGSFKLKV